MTSEQRPAFRRYRPFTRFRLAVANEGEVVRIFKPLEVTRLAFVLAVVDDPLGLQACTMQIKETGDRGKIFLAPDDNAQDRAAPPLSFLVPEGLFRADEYPSLVDGLVVGPGADVQSFDVTLQNLRGDPPYNVDLYFFAYPAGC